MKTTLLHIAYAASLLTAPWSFTSCTDAASESTDDVDDAQAISAADVKSDGQGIAFEPVSMGTPISGSTVRVIRSAARFQAVFGTPPPADLDFATTWLAVYRTSNSESNQRISFQGVEQAGSTLRFKVQRELPDAADCAVPNAQTFQTITFNKPSSVARAEFIVNEASFLCDELPPPPPAGTKRISINIDRNTWGDVVLRPVDANQTPSGDEFHCPADSTTCVYDYTPRATDVNIVMHAFTASNAVVSQLPTGAACRGVTLTNDITGPARVTRGGVNSVAVPPKRGRESPLLTTGSLDNRGVGLQRCVLPLTDATLSVAFNKRDKEVYTELFTSQTVSGDPTVKWAKSAAIANSYNDPIYGRTFPIAGGKTAQFLPPFSTDAGLESLLLQVTNTAGQLEQETILGGGRQTYTDVSSDGCVSSLNSRSSYMQLYQGRLTDSSFNLTTLIDQPNRETVGFDQAVSTFDCTHRSVAFHGSASSEFDPTLDNFLPADGYIWFDGTLIPRFISDSLIPDPGIIVGSGSRYRAAIAYLGRGYTVLTVSSY
jgi:hypothetical protein